MTNYTMIQTSSAEIKDPKLRTFVENLTEIFKSSICQAAYYRSLNKQMKYSKLKVGVKKTKEYASVGEIADKWLATKNPVQIKTLAQSPVLSSRLSALVKGNGYVTAGIDFKKELSYVNDRLIFERFAGIWGIGEDDDSSSDNNSTPTTPVATVLKLNLKKVKCLDDTSEIGKDEISAGGVAVDDKEVESKINEFSVGKFETGTSKTYSPVKVLKSFTLDSVQPSIFCAFLTIAEKDSGGFSDFLHELYEAIKAEVVLIFTALGTVAGAAIGTAIGGTVGTAVAGPLGTIIGIAAGVILGALIGWLVSVLKDDYYEPQITAIRLESNAPFTSPVQTLNYADHGGSYTMEVYWSAN